MSDFDCTLLASITAADNALALNTLQTNVLTSMKGDLDFAGGLMNKIPSVNSFSMRSEFRSTINKVIQNLDKHLDLANRASNQKVFEIAVCPDDKIEGTIEQGSNSFGAVGVYQNTFAYNKYVLGTKNLGNAFLSAPADPVLNKSLFLNDAETYSQFPADEVETPQKVQAQVRRMVSAADIKTMYESTNFFADYSNDNGVDSVSVRAAGNVPTTPGDYTLNPSTPGKVSSGKMIYDNASSGTTIHTDYENLKAEVFINSAGLKVNMLAYAAKNKLAVLLLKVGSSTPSDVTTNLVLPTDVLSISNGSDNEGCGGVGFYYINRLSTKSALAVESADRKAIQAQNAPAGAKINKLLKTIGELRIDSENPNVPITPETEVDYLNLENAINYSAVVASAQGDIGVLINRNAIMACAIKTNRKFLQALYDNVHGNAAFDAGSYANLCDC